MQSFVRQLSLLTENFVCRVTSHPHLRKVMRYLQGRIKMVTSADMESGPSYCAAATLHRFNVHYHCMAHVK